MWIDGVFNTEENPPEEQKPDEQPGLEVKEEKKPDEQPGQPAPDTSEEHKEQQARAVTKVTTSTTTSGTGDKQPALLWRAKQGPRFLKRVRRAPGETH